MTREIELTIECLFGKWNPICMGCMEDLRGDNCPFCQEYGRGCAGCPVSKRTKRCQCSGSPYWDFVFCAKGSECSVKNAEYAEAMFDFLVSLLPKRLQSLKALERLHKEWVERRKNEISTLQ
jgi:hypothetical protein